MSNEHVAEVRLDVVWQILQSRDLDFTLLLGFPWERVDLNRNIRSL